MGIQKVFGFALLAGAAILANPESARTQAIVRGIFESPTAEPVISGARVRSKIVGDASEPASTTPANRSVESTPKPMPFRNPEKPNELDKAYLDAYMILRERNSCSDFFGGPDSIAALNELFRQLRPTYLDSTIALKMSGPTTTFQSNRTGFSFRIFAKADLNLDGPFYRGKGINTNRVPALGGFPPNTREARLTVLLHELGHLIRLADKHWVLPDDGEDAPLSRKNTERILETCSKQIESISKIGLAQELSETRGQLANRLTETPPRGQ